MARYAADFIRFSQLLTGKRTSRRFGPMGPPAVLHRTRWVQVRVPLSEYFAYA